jgi:hypothetical protein
MAEAVSTNVASSVKYNQTNCDLSASECSNCAPLVKQLNSVLEELESAKLIIRLLQQESIEHSGVDNRTSEATNSSNKTNAFMYPNGPKQDKWTTSTKKFHRKGYPPKYSTEANKFYAFPTTNRYERLHNLQDTLMQTDTLLTQEKENTLDTNNYDYHTQLHHQRRERTQRVVKTKKEDHQTHLIPTLINGTANNKNSKTVSSERICGNNVSKNKLSQHTVSMIGDSFLRGIRDNVDLSLSNKFNTYSMVKPGGDLKTILESAKYAAENLTLEDVIVICGGSNDFSLEQAEPTTDHIREFVKTYN